MPEGRGRGERGGSGARALLVAGLCAATLAVKLRLAGRQSAPGYGDVAHYFALARNLFEGRGAWIDCAANWLARPEGLPVPGTQYWMPVPAWTGALGMLALSEGSFRAACLGVAAVTSLLPLVAYLTGRDLLGSARAGLLGALLAASFHLFLAKGSLPLTHGPAALLGGLALWAAVRSLERRAFLWVFGLCAALAQSNRSDGVLWLPALAVAHLVRARGEGAPALRALLGLWPAAVAWAVGMLPLAAVNLATQGSPWPGSLLRAALLTTYPELYSLPERITAAHWLDQGVARIAADKARAGLANALTLVAGMATGEEASWARVSPGQAALAALAWIGARPLLSRRAAVLWAWAALSFALYTLVFTHTGVTSFRPACWALFPALLCAAGRGAALVGRALARPLPVAGRAPAAVAVAALLLAGISADGAVRAVRWSHARGRQAAKACQRDVRLAQELADAGLGDGVFLVDQTTVYGFHAHTRLPCASIPYGAEPDGIADAGARIGATHLLLQDPPPTLGHWPGLARLPASPRFARVLTLDPGDGPVAVYRLLP